MRKEGRKGGRRRGMRYNRGVETGARSTHMFITGRGELRQSPLADPQAMGMRGEREAETGFFLLSSIWAFLSPLLLPFGFFFLSMRFVCVVSFSPFPLLLTACVGRPSELQQEQVASVSGLQPWCFGRSENSALLSVHATTSLPLQPPGPTFSLKFVFFFCFSFLLREKKNI